MNRRNLIAAISISLLAAGSAPALAQAALPELCLGAGAATLGPEGGADSNAEAFIASLEGSGARYTQSGCTAFTTCPSGQQISCSGSPTCSATTVTCSAQGSTCPGQATTVGAVICNGSVQQACPCPGVCFGCNLSCHSNADCVAACNCGSLGCQSGKCRCKF